MATRKSTNLVIDNKIELPSGTGFTPQSLAFISASKRIVFCSGDVLNNVLVCSEDGYSIVKNRVSVGRAGGCTYCSKNGLVYVTAYNGAENAHKLRALDPKDWSVKFDLTLPTAVTGIAYDRVTTDFYVSAGDYIYTYTYNSLNKDGKVDVYKRKFIKKFTSDEGRSNQDIGGYNGIVLCCKGFDDKGENQVGYIDCYDAASGDYIKSFSCDYGEIESVAVDKDKYLHVLFARDRKLAKTATKLNLKGSSKDGTLAGGAASGSDVVKKARSYRGQTGTVVWNSSNDFHTGEAFCVEFIWFIMHQLKLTGKCFPKNAIDAKNTAQAGSWLDKNAKLIYKHGGKGKITDAQPGDLVLFSFSTVGGKVDYSIRSHIGIISKKCTSSVVYSIDGNTTDPKTGKSGVIADKTRDAKNVHSIYRPKYGDGLGDVLTESGTLVSSPEQLYSSSVFGYDNEVSNGTESASVKLSNTMADGVRSIISGKRFTVIPDNIQNIQRLTNATDKVKRNSRKVYSPITGSRLPYALNVVEAPYIELTIGGITFGTYQSRNSYDSYPNYVNSLRVTKTNGSMNEYLITLVHQIRPGDNPNYIDNLLSINGYDTISIRYGDANASVEFRDDKALLIGVSESFDFTNCNINYTLKATSSSILASTYKTNFPAVTDKPSNIIRGLLYDSNNSLLEAFPGMANRLLVEERGLLPTSDVVVEVDKMDSMNPFSYIQALVSMMSNGISKNGIQNSSYFLTIEDDAAQEFGGAYFRITEVQNGAAEDFAYEVDINYAEDNMVYSFSVDTDYAWSLAYDTSSTISNYKYEIDNYGDPFTYNNKSFMKSNIDSNMLTHMYDNWFTQVSEHPIKASLTVKGLVKPMLILSYIKINCFAYGNKLIDSGVYIVTGQTDELSGSGYKTTLSLLKVSADNQYIDIDGRVVT